MEWDLVRREVEQWPSTGVCKHRGGSVTLMMWSRSDVGDLFKIKGIVNTEKSDSEPPCGESWLMDPKRTDRKNFPRARTLTLLCWIILTEDKPGELFLKTINRNYKSCPREFTACWRNCSTHLIFSKEMWRKRGVCSTVQIKILHSAMLGSLR